jgi:uncharacterized protein YyaL (SSP411 family)
MAEGYLAPSPGEGLAAVASPRHDAPMPSRSPFSHVARASLLLAGSLLAQTPTPTPAQRPTPTAQEPALPTNRLAGAASPYLRQHQHDPVAWWPWGPEALAAAKAQQKPIFLSIGYAACHWCHVMAAESFRDPAIAKLLNEQFVCIKVDREERPDVDEIYLTAVQAMGRPGGWPLSVWLTPDGKPFFGGTYFPPKDRDGLPGFQRVCEQLAKAWREQRDEVQRGAQELTQHLQQVLAPAAGDGELAPDLGAALVPALRARFDSEHAGFAAPPSFAPKFPSPIELLALLQRSEDDALAMATTTLRALLRGAIHDQLGGGFHRYTVDRRWQVPHFEKMLHDNALLAQGLLVAHRRTGDAAFADGARSALDFVLAELALDGGAYGASLDAESDGGEGRFYTWTQAEFATVLGDDAALVQRHFGVVAAGPVDGRCALHVAVAAVELAGAGGARDSGSGDSGSRDDVAARLASARTKLAAARAARPRPALDDKVVVAWNGFLLQALAEGYAVLGEARYLAAAQRLADVLLRQAIVDGRLRRVVHGGKAHHAACLDDHGALAGGLLALFETDANPRWLAAARQLLQQAVQHFGADDGGFHFTADDGEALVARSKNAVDGATPSGTALVAAALLRAGLLLGDDALYTRGLAALRATVPLLRVDAAAAPGLQQVLAFHLGGPREIVVAGAPDDARTQALLRAAWRAPVPHVVALVHDGNAKELAALSPVFAGKLPVAEPGAAGGTGPAAYVCRRGVCERPLTDPRQLEQLR